MIKVAMPNEIVEQKPIEEEPPSNVFKMRVALPNGTKDSAKANAEVYRDVAPDQAAKNINVADKLKVELPLVEADPKYFSDKSEEPDYNWLLKNAPSTTDYLTDKQNSSVSRDDTEALSKAEFVYKDFGFLNEPQEFKPFINPDNFHFPEPAPEVEPENFFVGGAKAIARTPARATYTLGAAANKLVAFGGGILAETAQGIENLTGLESGGLFESIQEFGLSSAESQEKVLQGKDEVLGVNLGLSESIRDKRLIENPSLLLNPEWMIQNFGDAAASMIPIIATHYISGGSTGIASLIGGAQEGTALFAEMVREGKVDRATSLESAMAFGAASSLLNKIGLDRIFSKSVAKGVKDRVFRAIISGGVEGATEWLEEPTQALIKTLAEDGTSQEIIDAVKEGATNIDVIPGAFLLGGGMSFVSQGPSLESQERSKKFRDRLSAVGAALDLSKTKVRSPEAVEKFLETLGFGEEGYLDSDRADILFQTDSEIAGKLGIDVTEAAKDIKAGHPIPVDIKRVLSRLNPEERDAIINDLKPAPSALSFNESQEINDVTDGLEFIDGPVGIPHKTEVIVEETGEVVEIEKDIFEARQDTTEEQDKYERLRDCLSI
jgi:hypothetical protein